AAAGRGLACREARGAALRGRAREAQRRERGLADARLLAERLLAARRGVEQLDERRRRAPRRAARTLAAQLGAQRAHALLVHGEARRERRELGAQRRLARARLAQRDVAPRRRHVSRV